MSHSSARRDRRRAVNPSRPIRHPSREPSNNQHLVLLDQLQSLGFGPDGPFQTVGLISSKRQEGVTTVACNLALSAAMHHGLRVLLIDANFSRPSLHRLFQLDQSPGLADLINGNASESECIHDLSERPVKSWPTLLKTAYRRIKGLSRFSSWERESPPLLPLSVLPVGSNDISPQELLRTDNTGFLAHACEQFDLTIVDLQDVPSAATSAFSLSKLDGVLLVLEAESTSDIAAQKSLSHLRQQGANVLGVVLNKSRRHLPKWIDRRLGD